MNPTRRTIAKQDTSGGGRSGQAAEGVRRLRDPRSPAAPEQIPRSKALTPSAPSFARATSPETGRWNRRD